MKIASIKKVFGVSVLVWMAMANPAQATEDSFLKSITRQELVQNGKETFQARCSGCHGVDGDGNGLASATLNPKPRNFKTGVFKFKSGPVGSMPTDADLFKTLNQGIIGTSMPSFRLMSEPQKLALVEYIKSLAPDAWKSQSTEASVVLPQMPAGVFTRKQEFLKWATNGRVWFQEMGCVSCHGDSGKGDGPSAATLNDTWGQPILPANLHKPFVKRGYSVQDVAQSISMGVDGTPMPGYLDSVPDKSIVWELVAYVFYMRGRGAGMYPDEPIKAIPASKIPQDEVNAVIGKYITQ
jgi:cytochrome c oxidase cbb3-type subunit 2